MADSKNIVLFDSNIWIYSFDKENKEKYEIAKILRDRAMKGELIVASTPQNYTESFRAITDKNLFKTPFSPVTAEKNLKIIWNNTLRLYPNVETMDILPKLIRKYAENIRSLAIYDAFLVATMLGNEVDTIYTDNEADFSYYEEINLINPFG